MQFQVELFRGKISKKRLNLFHTYQAVVFELRKKKIKTFDIFTVRISSVYEA